MVGPPGRRRVDAAPRQVGHGGSEEGGSIPHGRIRPRHGSAGHVGRRLPPRRRRPPVEGHGMSGWTYVYVICQFAVLVYFAVLNLLYAWFGYLGLRSIMIYARALSQLSLTDALERDLDMPVSILVPAYNEELSIVASIGSLLSLHYPEFEVIVVSDGSSDGTIARLVDGFALVEQPRVYRRVIDTATVVRSFRSLRHPNL